MPLPLPNDDVPLLSKSVPRTLVGNVMPPVMSQSTFVVDCGKRHDAAAGLNGIPSAPSARPTYAPPIAVTRALASVGPWKRSTE